MTGFCEYGIELSGFITTENFFRAN